MKFLSVVLLTYAVFAFVFLLQPSRPRRLKTTDQYQLLAVDSSRNVLIETPRYTGVIFAQEENPMTIGLFTPAEAELFTPSPEQVLAAEDVLMQCSLGSNMPPNEPVIYPDAIWPLEQYRRQYLGYRRKSGETIILINCFHQRVKRHFPKWQRQIIDVQDGGKNYFHVSVDLTNRRCFHFVRNSIGG